VDSLITLVGISQPALRMQETLAPEISAESSPLDQACEDMMGIEMDYDAALLPPEHEEGLSAGDTPPTQPKHPDDGDWEESQEETDDEDED
jgi:hypothetical protein